VEESARVKGSFWHRRRMTIASSLTSPGRRRRWAAADRARIVSAAFAPGAVVIEVARENAVSAGLIYKWREQARLGEGAASFAPVVMAREPASTGGTDAAVITVELVAGRARVSLRADAPPALAAAALGALR
jgi:transposase